MRLLVYSTAVFTIINHVGATSVASNVSCSILSHKALSALSLFLENRETELLLFAALAKKECIERLGPTFFTTLTETRAPRCTPRDCEKHADTLSVLFREIIKSKLSMHIPSNALSALSPFACLHLRELEEWPQFIRISVASQRAVLPLECINTAPLGDIIAEQDSAAVFLRARERAKKMTAAVFCKILESQKKPILPELFFADAPDDVLSQVDSIKTIAKALGTAGHFWKHMKIKQVVHLIVLFMKEKDGDRDFVRASVLPAFRKNCAEIVRGRSASDIESDIPAFLFHDNIVLANIGPRCMQSFSTAYLTAYGTTPADWLTLDSFKGNCSAAQFQEMMSGSDYALCKLIKASQLKMFINATLRSFTDECLSQVTDWASLDNSSAEIVEQLGVNAFKMVNENVNEHVMRHISDQQMAVFDEQHDPDYRCRLVDPSHLRPSHAAVIDLHCFANALAHFDKKTVKLQDGFLARARVDLFDHVEAGDAAKVLISSDVWSSLKREISDRLLARGDAFCHLLRVPAITSRPAAISSISASCFREILPDEQVRLLESPLISVLAEDALVFMTSTSKTRPDQVINVLKRVARQRPSLLLRLNDSLDATSDHYCSLLDFTRVFDQLDESVTAHLPRSCYAAMKDIHLATLGLLSKLPPLVADVVDIQALFSRLEWKTLREDEWRTIHAGICRLMSREHLDMLKSAIANMNGPCWSELTFELTRDEVAFLRMQAVKTATPPTIAKYYRHFSLQQLGAVDANAAGITSFAELSVDQIGALMPQAFTHIPAFAFETLGREKKLWALSPSVMSVLTLGQFSKIPLPVIVVLTLEQAKALGTAVKDKNQDPRLFFCKEVHAKMPAKVQEIIPISQTNRIQAKFGLTLLAGLVALLVL